MAFLSQGRHSILLTPTEAVLRGPGGVVSMKLAGANSTPTVEGVEELPGRSNYFIGNDPGRWRTNIPTYARVRYRGVYRGVDLLFYGNQSQLEYDFVVAPGADPGVIRVEFAGVEQLSVDDQGDLVFRTGGAKIRQRKPFIYQEVNGTKREIAGRHVLHGQYQVGFELASYDPRMPLVIDPLLTYSSLLGGRAGDEGNGIAVDSAGNAYVVGSTDSGNFPTTGAFQSANRRAPDAFVTKINASGTALIYSTYLGGTQTALGLGFDTAFGVAVDQADNAYVTGSTWSADFPTTTGVFQRQFAGGMGDVFITKLNPSGSALLYSGYLGGSDNDVPSGIALDSVGNAYLSGYTVSPEFPTTAGAFDRTFNGGFPQGDVFVAKISSTGSALVYSTFLGGSDNDSAAGIAVDSSGRAYVVGSTDSGDFPTAGTLQASKSGRWDVFVTELAADGSGLVYSTYLGGGDVDEGRGIAVDSTGNTYVTGRTGSIEFPTRNAVQPDFGGFYDAFVAKLSTTGAALVYSTYLGGSSNDGGFGIAVDAKGNAYLTGLTSSANFPLANAVQDASGGVEDAFVVRINAAGSAVLYSTYLGGEAADEGRSIALSRSGDVFVTGRSLSPNFPTTSGAFQPTFGGGDVFVGDAFVAKLATDTVVTLSAASFAGRAVAPESIASAFGEGLALRTEVAARTPLPTALADTSISVTDSVGVARLAPLFFVSPGQINFLVPAGTRSGLAIVMVTVENQTVATGTMRIEPVAPALFSANTDGRGVAAALAVQVSKVGTQRLVPVYQCADGPGKCTSTPLEFGPATDQLLLILFGTGIRGRSALSAARVTIGGLPADVPFAGAQGEFVGLDQLNILVPESVAGRGEVPLTLSLDDRAANPVRVNIGRRIPPPCDLTLASGDSLRFPPLPAVSTPTLISLSSPCIYVPEQAARMEIRLTTATPGVNVDLFVRLGDPPVRSPQGIVADYGSEGPDGNELVVVTPASSPPLRSGAYFLGLGILTTGTQAATAISVQVN